MYTSTALLHKLSWWCKCILLSSSQSPWLSVPMTFRGIYSVFQIIVGCVVFHMECNTLVTRLCLGDLDNLTAVIQWKNDWNIYFEIIHSHTNDLFGYYIQQNWLQQWVTLLCLRLRKHYISIFISYLATYKHIWFVAKGRMCSYHHHTHCDEKQTQVYLRHWHVVGQLL